MLKIEVLDPSFADPGACGRKCWKSSFWNPFSVILAPVVENAENRASGIHFRWSLRLWQQMLKIEPLEFIFGDLAACFRKCRKSSLWGPVSAILALAGKNMVNPAPDGHFRWSWRLWPKMLKIDLLEFIFADPGACGRKCWKSSLWRPFSVILAPVAENAGACGWKC